MANFILTFRAILFVDGSPSDQLFDATLDVWHTSAFVVIQLDPDSQWGSNINIDFQTNQDKDSNCR